MRRIVTVERVTDFLKELHNDFIGNGVIDKIGRYYEAHNVPSALGARLQDMGVLKRINKSQYAWKNGNPNHNLAIALLEKHREKMSKKPPTPDVEDKISIDDIVNELMAYLDMAMEYDIPQEKWNKYMKDMFHKHHAP